jgi:hypothetical protein
MSIPYAQIVVTVSASFGYAQVEDPATDWAHLLIECDKLLYKSKNGRPVDKSNPPELPDFLQGQPT